MSATATARCPKCGRPTSTPAVGRDRRYCHFCRMEFESEIGYGLPSKRLEREERHKQNRPHRPYPSADAGD